MSSRHLIAYQNNIERAVLYGGSWQLALDNIKDGHNPTLVARSTDLSLASTQFDADLGADEETHLGAITYTNATTSAKVRRLASNDPSFASVTYDSGWGDWYRRVVEDPNWRHPNWFSGLPTDSDLEGDGRHVFLVSDEPVYGRYRRIEIDDTNNPDGYLDIGYVYDGPAWNPIRSHAYGDQFGYESNSLRDLVPAGRILTQARPASRIAHVPLKYLTREEALGEALDLDRIADIHGIVIYIEDYTDPVVLYKRTVIGKIEKLEKIARPNYPFYTKEYVIRGNL
jgi:hypothetical protein